MTIREAAEMWVRQEMSTIPLSVAEKLAEFSDYNDMVEVTPPSVNDRVYVFAEDESGIISQYSTDDDGNDIYTVMLDSGKEITVTDNTDFEVNHDGYFPMWGTLWTFENMFDIEWLENNLQVMANCGFRIYESEDYKYIFGIDGCGYSFYEAHWIPLYKARGLKWHDESEDE